MKKSNIKFVTAFITLLIISAFIFPVLSFAADEAGTGLIRCGNATTSKLVDGKTIVVLANPCDFNDAIALIQRVIDGIITFSWIIFTISFIYGGFLYMTSGANPGNKSKAISILWNTLKGFVIILTAWLIVYTLLTYLVPSSSDTSNSIFRFLKSS